MGIDRADDYDAAADWGVERAGSCGGADRTDGSGGRVAVEDRDRSSYFDQLQAAAENDAVFRFRERWAEHQERWPSSARQAVDRSADPPGSWRGDSGRYLDSAANAEVEARCERIAEAERTTISPAMRQIEAADPTRELVGWENRLKGPDRIKDKVAAIIEEQPDRTSDEAASIVPDCLRFTFCYNESRYTKGVVADVSRLKGHGWELVEARNTWDDDQYKGINSRWREPGTGIRVEVQFHTYTSYEAKQTAHAAYERLRDPMTRPTEVRELREIQRKLTSHIPIPPGASDIEVNDDAENQLLRDCQRVLVKREACGCTEAHRDR